MALILLLLMLLLEKFFILLIQVRNVGFIASVFALTNHMTPEDWKAFSMFVGGVFMSANVVEKALPKSQQQSPSINVPTAPQAGQSTTLAEPAKNAP